MVALLFSVLIGIIAGLRTLTAPAAVSWAAYAGWLGLEDTPLAFMGYPYAPFILTALALGELITDQVPTTPSRTVPVQFGARLLSGALSGACLGVVAGSSLLWAVAGMVGAVIGTLGGTEFRRRLAAAFGKDWPAALIEDAIAIVGAVLVMTAAV